MRQTGLIVSVFFMKRYVNRYIVSRGHPYFFCISIRVIDYLTILFKQLRCNTKTKCKKLKYRAIENYVVME